MAEHERVMRPMPNNSKECDACAGTGDTSPWEHDHHMWLRGEPIAVCGACRGAGRVSKWGFRLSARKVLQSYQRMNAILFGGPDNG
jgi:hypothetical protein